MADYTNPPRVKNVQVYKPNFYIYKFGIIYCPFGSLSASADSRLVTTPNAFRDFLLSSWRFYIEQILDITSSHYSIYISIDYSQPINGINEICFICAVYLIFEYGVFIPAFFTSGSNTQTGLSTNPYTFLKESIPFTPISAPTQALNTFKYTCNFIPWPFRLYGSYNFITQFVTAFNGTGSYPSSQNVVELYGCGMNTYSPTSAFFFNDVNTPCISFRYTFDELGIDSYFHANQYLNDLSVFTSSDRLSPVTSTNTTISQYGIMNGYSTLNYNTILYKNIPIINSNGNNNIDPSDSGETTVLINEILNLATSMNIRVYMFQSPMLFIKYGEYLLLVYRYARTKTLSATIAN